MIGMQYTFSLPDDYDMAQLRARVAERGPMFDKTEGLHQKAFLIAEKGGHGATTNRYAPFYCWKNADALSDFLTGEKFRAVSDAFGRPEVTLWMPLFFGSGHAKFELPTFATAQVFEIAADTDWESARAEQNRIFREWAAQADNHSTFIGVDASSWKMMRFALWTRPQLALGSDVACFEVLHLAAPGLTHTRNMDWSLAQ